MSGAVPENERCGDYALNTQGSSGVTNWRTADVKYR